MAIDTLVVNLTRFGDLLQCQPVLHDLQRTGHRTGILCLDNFKAALPMLNGAAASWTLPGARLLALTEARWPSALGDMLALTRHIREDAAPSHVINLTPNLPARLLAGLLTPPGRDLLGFGIDGDGFGVNTGVWASFLVGAALRRTNAPFNIIDMFRMVAKPCWGRDLPLPPGEFRLARPDANHVAKAGRLLRPAEEGADRIDGYVGLQLGASEPRRQWPIASFAELGTRLWKSHRLLPVLLGSADERHLAEAFTEAAACPFADAVGATDFPTLAGLLTRLKLLVTNDTATMHLAAGLGIPCIAFFLASAQVWDTGPYMAGCCCLEPAIACHPCHFSEVCDHGACKPLIRADGVWELTAHWLDTGSWRLPESHPLHTQARVWETAAGTDGLADVLPLSGHRLDERTWWYSLQRHFWRRILDDLDGGHDPAGDPLPAPLPAPFSGQVSETLSSAARLLELLGEERTLAERNPAAGQLFLRNCDRLTRLLSGCRHLESLAHFSRELLQQRADSLERTVGLASHLASWLHRWAAATA